MAQFTFNLKPLFPESIVRVSSDFLPQTIKGDVVQTPDVKAKIQKIIDQLGQLSAESKNLVKPVTSANLLSKSDNQVVYLMADVNSGSNAKAVGLLKVGKKNLYLFDTLGNGRQMDQTPCVLDFFVMESPQRTNLAKQLFDNMLTREQLVASKCAVDRPSMPVLDLLKNYYHLEHIIPQGNNFVVYDGFFENDIEAENEYTRAKLLRRKMLHINNASITNELYGVNFTGDEREKFKVRDTEGGFPGQRLKVSKNSPEARYGTQPPQTSVKAALDHGYKFNDTSSNF